MKDGQDREMDVVERVHIAPLGYEYERIVLPTLNQKADRAVLIDYRHDEERPTYHDQVWEDLREAGVTVESREADIFSLYDSIGTVARIIRENTEHQVYVNLASGSKVMAIGGMIACMAEGATPYYVRAEEYKFDGQEPLSEGVKETFALPAYPVEQPTAENIRILQALRDEGPLSKSELIDFGQRELLPFIQKSETESRRGKYRTLEARVINPLVKREYIRLESIGRRTLVEITANGRSHLQAFEYMIEVESNAE
jgi:hypothetical protein